MKIKKMFLVLLLSVIVLVSASCGLKNKPAFMGEVSGDGEILPLSDENSKSTIQNPNAEKTKQENINDEKFELKYKETQKAEGVQVNDRDVYKAPNGNVFEYDSVTGQLVYYSNENVSSSGKKISEDEALSIAQNFIKTKCDISKYQLVEVKQLQFGFSVRYSKFILGYVTSEVISVNLAANGEINYFIYNPYVFDNITVEKIDEKAILAKLESDLKSMYKTMISYKIEDKRLAVKENRVVMEFFVEITFEGSMYSGEVFSYPI